MPTIEEPWEAPWDTRTHGRQGTLQDVERYKQAFGRPGVATGAINYMRAALDTMTRSPNLAIDQ
jgi:hypothetical protein